LKKKWWLKINRFKKGKKKKNKNSEPNARPYMPEGEPPSEDAIWSGIYLCVRL